MYSTSNFLMCHNVLWLHFISAYRGVFLDHNQVGIDEFIRCSSIQFVMEYFIAWNRDIYHILQASTTQQNWPGCQWNHQRFGNCWAQREQGKCWWLSLDKLILWMFVIISPRMQHYIQEWDKVNDHSHKHDFPVFYQ